MIINRLLLIEVSFFLFSPNKEIKEGLKMSATTATVPSAPRQNVVGMRRIEWTLFEARAPPERQRRNGSVGSKFVT